jgi:hypothetical protein
MHLILLDLIVLRGTTFLKLSCSSAVVCCRPRADARQRRDLAERCAAGVIHDGTVQPSLFRGIAVDTDAAILC